MTFDLSEQPIDHADIAGEAETVFVNPYRQLDLVPSVHGAYLRLSFPEGREMVGCHVLVFDGDSILMVHLARPATDVVSWELPGGGLDKGERLSEAAVRELHEETGLAVTESDLTYLGSYRPNAGCLNASDYLYFARVNPAELHHEFDVEISERAWVPVEDVVAACMTGTVGSSAAVIAVLRARVRGLI